MTSEQRDGEPGERFDWFSFNTCKYEHKTKLKNLQKNVTKIMYRHQVASLIQFIEYHWSLKNSQYFYKVKDDDIGGETFKCKKKLKFKQKLF